MKISLKINDKISHINTYLINMVNKSNNTIINDVEQEQEQE